MDIESVKAESIGRWYGIFNSLGLEVGEGKHCPCPVCGGKDRFRFTDQEGRGTYFCNHCGAGDGFKLIQNFFAVDFVESCRMVEKVVGSCVVKNSANEPAITKEKLREIFNGSKPASAKNVAGKYLQNRGLSVIPALLRGTNKCWCSERKGEFPAMLAIFKMPDGTAATMHRTYVTKDGDKEKIEQSKKMLPALQKMSGGCVRLFPHAKHIAIAEGIETAIAVHEDTGLPVWAATTAVLLEKFKLPDLGIEQVSIFADNDANFTGQRAAYILANRLIKDCAVSVYVPPRAGQDWLDILNEQNGV